MIIITVEIPAMEMSCDFQIDEDMPLWAVRNEIADMICRRNQCAMNGDVRELYCWDKQRKILLDMNRTGIENGLETGSGMVMA